MQKEQIFEHAEKLFFAKSYTDVKLDNLANSLKIKKPTLYYYFTDKKDLFIQTIKYSTQKYFNELDLVINNKNNKNIKSFLNWYIEFPYLSKNLFGIAFQKNYCIDPKVKTILMLNKTKINEKITIFLSQKGLSNIQIYLLITLLEKITIDNCFESKCIKYDMNQIIDEIYNIFFEKV